MHPFASTPIDHFAAAPGRGTAIAQVLPAGAIDAAAREIGHWPGYAPTPLRALSDLARRLDVGAILYKDEGPRFGLDSFKALGGAYAALRVLERELSRHLGHPVTAEDVRTRRHPQAAAGITLITATDGNHGRSVAWGARRFGAPCRIYIHGVVSESRAEALRSYGAEVVRVDDDYDATVAQTRIDAERHGWFIVSDTSWPGYTEPPRDVMAGYGVMGREICRQTDPATHVFLQGGVGGLAAALTAALRQGWGAVPRIVVVEPDLAPCLIASARAGAATTVPIHAETIMAGLSCGEPSQLAWQILTENVQDFLAIPDGLVAPAMRLLARPPGSDLAIEAGESAVAGLCGAMAAALQPDLRAALGLTAESRILVIGSEGITDAEIYARILAGADAL